MSLFPEIAARVRAIGSHQSSRSDSCVWLTPPHILNALWPFDLDPCAAPEPRPWPTANIHWTQEDGSLLRPWFGRVWLNPPYGPRNVIAPWLHRMADHNNGIALIFARTETDTFFKTVWDRASGIFFFRGRLSFHRPDGTLPRNDVGGGNCGAPSVLVAYGDENRRALQICGLDGKCIVLR